MTSKWRPRQQHRLPC